MSDFDRKTHWEHAWTARPGDRLSWYQAHPAASLAMIRHAEVGATEPLIDVGGGAARLVDCLLDAGFDDLTVLDVSATALDQARHRLGKRAERVHWVESDVTRFEPTRGYALWHDRAVFHFLTEDSDRARYIRVMDRALAPGGQAIIATFARGGPERCSGLPVVQYDADRLCAELGERWLLLEEGSERHATPAGANQEFAWFRFARDDAPPGVGLKSRSED